MEVSGIETHIPYLDEILLLGAACYPVALSYPINSALFSRLATERANTGLIMSMAISSIVVVLVAFSLAPKYVLFVRFPAFWFYPAAVLLGPSCLTFEYIMNGLYLYLQKGIFPKRFSIHSFWSKSDKPLHLFLMFFIAAGEELIFRQMMFSILTGVFEFSVFHTLLFTSFVYAANHLFMGFNTAATKFVTGMIYGSLYYISGLSIIVPIIVHYIQNITLLRFHWIVQENGYRF